ncbi:hypothetical protein AMJ50_01200 [Parcubacteria bacterium DG_74_3]|nr:MAG: hypothetical protein AMJ50_01200 [Parcubacteria bacterium DG_74_3]
MEKEIFSGKSKSQKIEIFETKEFGRVLALDGLIQLSTKDEAVYHEMLVQPAMFYCQNPKKALIIGGGDGGVLREVVKHPVKEIYLVDIDKKIVEVSKKYLPTVSRGAFKDKRLKIFYEDALKYIQGYKNFFDVIINDLTDPTGPSLTLWTKLFYRDIFRALKEKGIASFQTAYIEEKFAKRARKRLKKIFPYFRVHKAFVGCFPFNEHTFSFGSKKTDFEKFTLQKIRKKYKKLKIKTKYYTPEIHFASAIFGPKQRKKLY